jgi:hypothetical protein
MSKKKRPRPVAPEPTPAFAPTSAPEAATAAAPADHVAAEAAPAPPAEGPSLEPRASSPAAVAPTAAEAEAATGPVRGFVATWPHLIVREATLVLGLLAALTVAAVVFAAPLGPPADPARPENPEKAPWYFVGLQEMASYSTPLGAVAFPLALGALLLAAPLCGRVRRPGLGRALALVALAALAVTVGAVAAHVRGSLGGSLVNPAGVALAAALLAAGVVGARTRSARGAVMAALVALAVAYLVFVLVGALCRGPGWQFFWPWQAWPEVGY